MNLHAEYVPTWDEWAVVRELVCNALDADPDYALKFHDDQKGLDITTHTIPSLDELLVIGKSTSRGNNDKIGQFGEGFKLTALVTTRMQGKLEVRLPNGLLKFSLDNDILYANFDKRFKGSPNVCVTTLRLPNEIPELHTRFCDPTITYISKQVMTPLRIFVKGVYIATLKELSIWDWNLNSLELNRDRSLVNLYYTQYEIARALTGSPNAKVPCTDMTTRDIENLFEHPTCLETTSFKTLYQSYKVEDYKNADLITSTFYKHFGQRAVIMSSYSAANQMAMASGHPLAMIPQEFRYLGLPLATDLTHDETNLTIIDDVPQHYFDEIHLIKKLLNIPPGVDITVYFFKDFDEAAMGYANQKTNTIYINELLLNNSVERLGTITHELAHIMSAADDCSVYFENTLTDYCGQLINKLMSQMSKEV
jgi:hypothetical protein